MSDFANHECSGSETVEVVGEHVFPCLSAIEVLELSFSSIYNLSVSYDPFGGVPNDVEGFPAPRRIFFLYLQGESFPVFSCGGDREDAVWQIQHLPEIVAQAFSSPSRQSFVELGVTFRRSCRKDLDMLQHRVGVVPDASDTLLEGFELGGIIHIGEF